ncbi:hypothetical protein [Bacteroides caecimuris]|jgi:Cdc6-like AAA superfamily ATPase|uniref:Uncharacterized protein n=2 Tax=Bacteroides TaxID=816 RepID=A0A1C7GXA9_9BACE|nr:hypothetical protein [Bacteroides caecimuris]ANU56975.1 hypothetical protein A4V03_04820 [Bacteroides caecimuris]OXE66633.1 hypothetical protein ADH74_03455 [Bacteroides caecimuris]QQR18163.1 hypothetical protein I5Q79_04350 [Bacteroides caecimuris]UQA31175.1 hypothetical protein M2854_04405 [Bacteroides caecimuris]
MSMDILGKLSQIENQKNILKEKFFLNYNPFPKSGIAIINESDDIVSSLSPVNDEVVNTIFEYIKDALYNSATNGKDLDNKYISLIVRGEYGSGKTQTLMYIKYLLQNLKLDNIRPYVIYIDNPGQKLSELIGGIISQIGIENFRKYLWNIFISYLDNNIDAKQEILKEATGRPIENTFFSEQETSSLLLIEKIQNYKELIDSITIRRSATEKKSFIQLLKDHMIRCFIEESESAVVASYFYDIVSETIGISKSWDMLVTGNVKELDKREVNILKAIVGIVQKQLGYTDFIILIDEFEEITAERLKKSDVDNYLRNLRLLIDREKNWCSVFAMTGKALSIIESYSPPLAGRIKGSFVDLKPLNEAELKKMIANYLSIARSESIDDDIYPFDESGIKEMLEVKDVQLKGSPRFILKLCYTLLQRAVDELPENGRINQTFVKQYMKVY